MKDFCKKKICYGMTWHEKWVKKEPKRQKNAKKSKESLKKTKNYDMFGVSIHIWTKYVTNIDVSDLYSY